MYPKTSTFRALVLGAIVATFPLPVRAVPIYTLTVSAGTAAAHVYPTMFGTNVVYDAVDVAQWPTFLSTFNALGMKSLRYPGGVVTEAEFDFKDSNGPANDCITLTHFLQAVAANN